MSTSGIRAYGITTKATIREVHHFYGRYSESYVVVEFTAADGQQITTDVTDYFWWPEPQVGGVTELLYDPADPWNRVLDPRVGPDFLIPAVCFVGALIFAVIGALYLRRLRAIR